MMDIDHIGYAVRSVDEAAEKMKFLGFGILGPAFDDEKRNVRILFVSNGPYRVELIAPLDPNIPSPVDNILKKGSPGPYHFCYGVDCLKSAVQTLKEQGLLVIEPPSWAEALDTNVAFLFDRSLGVIELAER